MKYIQTLKPFWHWLTNRSLEVEHLGMVAVILISTWHVSQHMSAVEGSITVAVIMGAVLGLLNALFAMRFFEERKETRWPAGIGALFFAAVSVWMQYGFYDANSDLQPYMLGNVNVNALAFGAWAPVSEILLGWLYGVRLFVRGESEQIQAAIKSRYDQMVADIQAKFDRQLTVNQQLRDEMHVVKTTVTQRDQLIADKDGVIDKLRSDITELMVGKAALGAELSVVKSVRLTPPTQPVNQPSKPVKLTTEERRAKVVELAKEGRIVLDGKSHTVTAGTLSKATGAAVNTIKADLKALHDAGLLHVNGSIKAVTK